MKKRMLLILVSVLTLSFAGCTDEESPAEPQNEQEETVNKEPQDVDVQIDDFMACPTLSAEKNSTAAVDEIASIAEANASAMTDEQAAAIIDAIRTADHKFYNGPEEMEKYMWYGYLLDYKYDDSDPRSELGTDLCQAIKYVYRNVETVLDDSTKENLNQIDEALRKIN